MKMTPTPTPTPTPHRSSPAQVQEESTPAYFADDLTRDGKLAFICHQDQVYTLRITRADKLILTK